MITGDEAADVMALSTDALRRLETKMRAEAETHFARGAVLLERAGMLGYEFRRRTQEREYAERERR